MAEQEKDNTTLVFAVCVALAIGGVLLLKSRETEHLKNSGPTTAKAEAEAFKAHKKDFNNDILGQAK